MPTAVRIVAICGAAICLACCEESTVQSAKSVDGAVAHVVSRGCGATVGFVTRVMLGRREILLMNADARTVSVRWESDGKTLLISIPDDVTSRDIFAQKSSADGRAINYRRVPPEP
jgi:hypothetical protein